MKLRKAIYVTGTRADYGLMREVLKKLDTSAEIELSICVTGMHLQNLYGNTIKEIEADQFNIFGIIPVDLEKATHSSMVKAIGHEIIGMSELFEREQPDLILVLGDRGEMLAAAVSAIHLNIPIVHIHGGERSGTVDEMIRHAISKMSHYHFVATEGSKERLIKMGERAETIYVVGAPGLDQIKNFKASEHSIFCERYGLVDNKKTALVIYHPVVQEYEDIKTQFQNAMDAALSQNLQILCFEPNSDTGSQSIRAAIEDYRTNENIKIIKHCVREEFLDCLANIDIMIGNSSSGIIEAASFDLVVVNVGSRQNLRECGDNVINVDASFDSVTKGIKEVLHREPKSFNNIYGDGNTSERCYQLLKTISLDPQLLTKSNEY